MIELPPGHPERKSFILKPSITNKGAEIHVFDTEEKLRNIFEPKKKEEEEGGEEEKRRIPKLLNDYYYYGALKGVKIDCMSEGDSLSPVPASPTPPHSSFPSSDR
jgi:hypothetical protein